MKAVRILLVLAALALLAWGLLWESHQVRSLDGSAERAVSGPGFTEGATYDAFVRRDGRLYDVLSLQPEAAQSKDCKT
jgi:hypothetical protein